MNIATRFRDRAADHFEQQEARYPPLHARNIEKARKYLRPKPVWNHTIRFRPLENGKLHCTDEIEIQAGLLTGVVWAFAHVFYRHRQRRWRRLLRSET